MPWPEDDPIFQWKLYERVVLGDDANLGCVGTFIVVFFLGDLIQSAYITDFCVSIKIIEFIKELISFIS